MRLSKAIDIQEREIADLETEINILINMGKIDQAVEKEKRKEMLINQINLAKVINL